MNHGDDDAVSCYEDGAYKDAMSGDFTPEMVGSLGDTDTQRLTALVAINIDLRTHIEALEADMDQITGLLAGVGTFYTRSEVLERIDFLPSVQAAWERNLGGGSSDNDYQGD